VIACCTVCTRPCSPYIDEFTAFSTADASAMSLSISVDRSASGTFSSASSNDN